MTASMTKICTPGGDRCLNHRAYLLKGMRFCFIGLTRMISR